MSSGDALPRTPTRAAGAFAFAPAASPTHRAPRFATQAEDAAARDFFPALFEWTQPGAAAVGITGSFNKCVASLDECLCVPAGH